MDSGYGGMRADICLKEYDVIIETKCTRETMSEKKLLEELGADAFYYRADTVFFFVYDPQDIIKNPAAMEKSFEKEKDRYGKNVRLLILQPRILQRLDETVQGNFRNLRKNEIDVLNQCVNAKLKEGEEELIVCKALEDMKKKAAEGDTLDIFEKDGTICIMPVAVYSKIYLNELRKEIGDIKSKIASREQFAFDNVDSLFDKLEAE